MTRSEAVACEFEIFCCRRSGNFASKLILMSNVVVGYGILVLVMAIFLAFYVCLRVYKRTRNPSPVDAGSAIQNSSATAAESAIVVPGLDQATLDSYPKFVYSERKQGLIDASACSICLADYKDSNVLRALPDCGHSFHVECIDTWMRIHATCPMCRTSPLPSPLSTPLSELVPLARHSARIQR